MLKRIKASWKRWALELLAILAIVAAVGAWQARGLPGGAAPPLQGMRTDGVAVDLAGMLKAGSGGGMSVPREAKVSPGGRMDVPPGAKVSLGGTAPRGVTTAGGPLLVDFWATWCAACIAEAGNIERVARRWPVVSVAIQSGDAAAVSKHLRERELALPAVVDADGRIAANWRVRGTPTHFIVDAEGNIRFRVVGYATTLGLMLRLWWAGAVPA